MSSSRDFIPPRDADFLAWSLAFASGISSSQASIGITLAQVQAYSDLNNEFQALMTTVSSKETRTPAKVIEKRESRQRLEAEARRLARIINAFPGTTNTKRAELGLTVRKDGPTPSPIPGYAPEVFKVAMNGHSMEIELRDADGKCRWPEGVRGATVLTRVGPNLVLDPEAYTLQGNTTRTRVTVDFPMDLAPGTQVWVTAYYRNAIDESGNAADPVGAQINFGNEMGQPAQLRKAA